MQWWQGVSSIVPDRQAETNVREGTGVSRWQYQKWGPAALSVAFLSTPILEQSHLPFAKGGLLMSVALHTYCCTWLDSISQF